MKIMNFKLNKECFSKLPYIMAKKKNNPYIKYGRSKG